MAKLGQLVIELAANTARLQSDMGKAVSIVEAGASKIKGVFKTLGVVGGGGVLAAVLGSAVREAIKFGDELQKAATKSGISGKAISELAYAAKLADVDLAALSTSIKKMQIALSQAGSGAKQPIEALAALGLTFEKLHDLKPDEQFSIIGDRISKLKDPADRARASVELFGKAGADLLPLFEQGAAGIAKAREEARRLGLAFNDDQLKNLSAADDATKRLKASWEGFAVVLTAKVAPAISSVLDLLSGSDTRDLKTKLDADIRSLENSLQNANFGLGGGVGGADSQRQAQMREELNHLRARRALLEAPKINEAGSRTFAIAPGFDKNGGDAAKAAAEKELKAREKLNDQYRDMVLDLNKDIDDLADDQLKADMQREAKRLDMADEWLEKWKDSEKKLAEFRAQQAGQLSETAQIWKDTFLQAVDDIVNLGKVRWDQLIKYMLVRLATAGIEKAFTAYAKNANGGGGGGAGIWKAIGSAVGSLFGGARASGGPTVGGKTYLIGEDGPELWRAPGSGTVVPNNAISAGGPRLTYAPVTHINNPDNTQALPRILRERDRRMIDELSRRHALSDA